MKCLAHPTDGADGGSKLANVPELTADQWTELVERLTLHASSKLRRLHWRGVSGSLGGKTPGGIEAVDLAQSAILDVIEGKRTWDPQADPDFLKFLQGVVDSKVSHLVEGLENRKSRRLGPASAGDENSGAYEVEASGPSPAELVVNRDSAETFRAAVIKCLEGDDLAYKVLECLEAEYTKPSEIAEMLGISVADVNNAQKRLRRKLDQLTNGKKKR
jgi:DNA-directed RNA polymerase specialized sigma24 family protein